MKKLVSVFLLALVMAIPVIAAMPFAPSRVIAINIGPKNPGLDESQFPDIKFVYTPRVIWSTKVVSGEPEVLVKWLNKKGMNLDTIALLDKNGIGDFVGFLVRDKGLVEAMSQGHLDSLGNCLKSIVEEGKPSIFSKNTPLTLDDLSGLIGRSFPTFEVVNSSGEAMTTTALINQNRPTLVFIYRIPADHKFKSPEEAMKNIQSPLEAIGGMVNVFQGDEYTELLKKVETDLYGR